jgi:hypothetical protein
MVLIRWMTCCGTPMVRRNYERTSDTAGGGINLSVQVSGKGVRALPRR